MLSLEVARTQKGTFSPCLFLLEDTLNLKGPEEIIFPVGKRKPREEELLCIHKALIRGLKPGLARAPLPPTSVLAKFAEVGGLALEFSLFQAHHGCPRKGPCLPYFEGQCLHL